MALPQYKTQPIYYERYALIQHALHAGHIDTSTGNITYQGYEGFRKYLNTHFTQDEELINAVLGLDYLRTTLGRTLLSWFMKEREELRIAAMQGDADYINSFYKIFNITRTFTPQELRELYRIGKLEYELSLLDNLVASWGALRFGYAPRTEQQTRQPSQPQTSQK